MWGDILLKYHSNNDVKIVTDLKINKELMPYATMLMPLTTIFPQENIRNKQQVWDYCTKNNIKYCLRQHIEVWGDKRGI